MSGALGGIFEMGFYKEWESQEKDEKGEKGEKDEKGGS